MNGEHLQVVMMECTSQGVQSMLMYLPRKRQQITIVPAIGCRLMHITDSRLLNGGGCARRHATNDADHCDFDSGHSINLWPKSASVRS